MSDNHSLGDEEHHQVVFVSTSGRWGCLTTSSNEPISMHSNPGEESPVLIDNDVAGRGDEMFEVVPGDHVVAFQRP